MSVDWMADAIVTATAKRSVTVCIHNRPLAYTVRARNDHPLEYVTLKKLISEIDQTLEWITP